MIILAFSDTHLSKECVKRIKKKAKEADFLICAGDISWFGMGLEEILEDLNSIGKPVYVIPGNHEEPGEQMKKVCKKFNNIIYRHKAWERIGGYIFFFWGEGGFAQVNKPLENKMKDFKEILKKDDQVVFVTHGPPYKTELDYLEWAGHVGCKSQRKFIREIKPILHISGHLHEHMHEQHVLFKKTVIINPGPDGTLIEL